MNAFNFLFESTSATNMIFLFNLISADITYWLKNGSLDPEVAGSILPWGICILSNFSANLFKSSAMVALFDL